MKSDQTKLLSRQALNVSLAYKVGDDYRYMNIENYGEYLRFLEFIQELDIPKLNSYQSKIALNYLNSYCYIDTQLPRQVGKSNIGFLLMCYMALNKPDSKILFTSRTLALSDHMLTLDCAELGEGCHESIVTKLTNSGKIAKVTKGGINSHFIEFANGSTITLTIPTKIEDVVYDYTFMDEVVFYRGEQYRDLVGKDKLKNRLILSSQKYQ